MVSVYVWTAPGPYVSGGLFHILLRVVPGRFHPEQKALVSALAFRPIRCRGGDHGRTREGEIESLLTQALQVPTGVLATLSRRSAARRVCPVRLPWRNGARLLVTTWRVYVNA